MLNLWSSSVQKFPLFQQLGLPALARESMNNNAKIHQNLRAEKYFKHFLNWIYLFIFERERERERERVTERVRGRERGEKECRARKGLDLTG